MYGNKIIAPITAIIITKLLTFSLATPKMMKIPMSEPIVAPQLPPLPYSATSAPTFGSIFLDKYMLKSTPTKINNSMSLFKSNGTPKVSTQSPMNASIGPGILLTKQPRNPNAISNIPRIQTKIDIIVMNLMKNNIMVLTDFLRRLCHSRTVLLWQSLLLGSLCLRYPSIAMTLQRYIAFFIFQFVFFCLFRWL